MSRKRHDITSWDALKARVNLNASEDERAAMIIVALDFMMNLNALRRGE